MKSLPYLIALAMVLSTGCDRAKESASHWASNAKEKAAEKAREKLHEGLDSLLEYMAQPIPRTKPVFPLSATDYPMLKGYAAYSAAQLPDSLVPKVDKFFYMESLVNPKACSPLLWPYQYSVSDFEMRVFDASAQYSLEPSPIPDSAAWHLQWILEADLQEEWLFALSLSEDQSLMSYIPRDSAYVALNMRTHRQWAWRSKEEMEEGVKALCGKTPRLQDMITFAARHRMYEWE